MNCWTVPTYGIHRSDGGFLVGALSYEDAKRSYLTRQCLDDRPVQDFSGVVHTRRVGQ